MFEEMYSGREDIEDKYLTNFSPKEATAFRRHIARRREIMEEFQIKLGVLMDTDSPAFFREPPTWPTRPLEIKYILNRIAANDPRDKSFTLSAIDDQGGWDPSPLAFHVVKAFQTNTKCKRVELSWVRLTDKDMLPILSVLRKKELDVLDIHGNKITDKTYQVLDQILADPENKWHQVKLGKVNLSPERLAAFSKYPNLSFTQVEPKGALHIFSAACFGK